MRVLGALLALAVIGALALTCAILFAMPRLPTLEAVTDYRPKVPMRIFTSDHVLIGEFGEERRSIVPFDTIPEHVKKAVLAIEDDRFYRHGGIDYIGIARAGWANLVRGGNAQGASTITMQVARNFFLSSEKTYTRKLYEMLLSYKIEKALTKDQILELYMNQIYLGQRAYGFGSAAQVYFGKHLKDLTLAQAAMLAGLPKAPSAYNPVSNPRRATLRQQYILKRMLDLGYIAAPEYAAALAEDIGVRASRREFTVHAEYVAETVRQMMVARYKDDAYTRGLNVVTTVRSGDQDAAYRAVRDGVLAYDRRHGYRGPEAFVALPDDADALQDTVETALAAHPDNGNLVAAVVLSAARHGVTAMRANGERVVVAEEGLRFVEDALPPHTDGKPRLGPGAVIRLMHGKSGWQIVQLPQVEGALVAITPQNGAIRAMVGGFDFDKNKFNHVTQAWRQPGSVFKPFIYSAALEKGLGPATLIADAPLFFSAEQNGGKAWAPKNYGGRYGGPTTMREALRRSRNLVTIRIMQHIGPHYAQEYVSRFGFDAERHPPYLPMALGSGEVTPLQVATGFSVFANGGFRIEPYLIAEVSDSSGAMLAQTQTPAQTLGGGLIAGFNAPRVIDARNQYIMHSMLHDVASHGSGARSNVLKRNDLAGKTGTTNDSRDAWFAGYQQSLVAVSWIGYDQPRSLGSRETGSGLALPVWIDYMATALHGVPEHTMPVPDGIVTIGGELYFADRKPSHGFVATIDVPRTNEVPRPIADDERQQVLEIFGSGSDTF